MTDFDSVEKGVGSYKPRMAKGRRVMYKPNHSSFGAFIRSDQMRRATVKVAMDIAHVAQQRTPSSLPGAKEHTGLHQRVKEGFSVVETPTPRNLKVGGNLRVVVQVVNKAKGSALVEFGANGLPRQRMLGAAGAIFGDFHDGKEA